MNAPARARRGGRTRLLLSAALLLAMLTGLPRPARSDVALEEWTADLALRLRLHDGDGDVRRLQASGLLRLDGGLSLFLEGQVWEGSSSLPELYLRYEKGAQRWELGRFYLPLGIYDYSELYYVGFIFIPLVKYYPFRGFVTYRCEQGLRWRSRAGRWSWETALIGGDGAQSTLGLSRPRGVVGRAQTSIGKLILGLNSYTGDESGRNGERTVHWYGLDGRFSFPQWVLRAEAYAGSIGGAPIDGFYVDLLHHAAALPRWTFLGRIEAVSGRRQHKRLTLGARLVLRPGLTLSGNWIDDDVSFPSDAGGWNLELQQTLQY